MMSDSRRYPIVFLFLALSLGSFSQTFNYRREIKGVKDNWQRINISPEIAGKCLESLEDLRIYKIKGRDTVEAPYTIVNPVIGPVIKDVAIDILNRSHLGNTQFITLNPKSKTTLSNIDLVFDDIAFDGNCKLEGSYDNESWFTLLEDQRIGAVNIDGIFYRYSSLKFEPSQYQYYRLSYPIEAPKLLNASVKRITTTDTGRDKISILGAQNSGRGKQTTCTYTFGACYPIDRIKLIIASTSFYRPVSIYNAIDSNIVNGSYNYDYELLYSGLITSWSSNEFNFDRTLSRRIVVIFENGDNHPLKVVGPELSIAKTEIVANFIEPGAGYYLYYGNEKSAQPDYELKYFKDRIPTNSAFVALGEEEDLRKPLKSRSPLELSTTWLWAVIGVIIVTLAGFTLNMWKKRA